MKNRLAIILSAIFAGGTLYVSDVGAAQEESVRGYGAGNGSASEMRQDPQRQQQRTGKQSEFRAANNLSGMQILNQQGKEIGQVNQVLVDMDQGRLAFVVVSSTATATGEQKYIVPWQMIRTSTEQDQLLLQISSLDQLRPVATSENIEQTITRQSGEEIFEFYGISPYWEEGDEQKPGKMPHEMPRDSIHQEMMERMHRQQAPENPR